MTSLISILCIIKIEDTSISCVFRFSESPLLLGLLLEMPSLPFTGGLFLVKCKYLWLLWGRKLHSLPSPDMHGTKASEFIRSSQMPFNKGQVESTGWWPGAKGPLCLERPSRGGRAEDNPLVCDHFGRD